MLGIMQSTQIADAQQKGLRETKEGAEQRVAPSTRPKGQKSRHEADSTPADRPARKRTPRGPARPKVRDLTRTPASELPARMLMGEVVQIFRISPRTLRQWIADGLVRVIQPAGHGGIVLIPKSEVLRLLGEN